MGFLLRHKWIAAGVVLLILFAGAMGVFNPRITRAIEGPGLRAELDKQTAKGLHFQSGQYDPLHRTGFLAVSSEGFRGKDGKKAMRSLDVRGLSAKFNPWGIFLRRWQLEDIHIRSGNVAIQVYEPKPEQKPPKPWYAIFLPDRVYLEDVVCDVANVTWRIRDEEGAFYKTRLHITPHDRDFNYEATGGTMRMPVMPDLDLKRVYMLITKETLTLYELSLSDGKKGSLFIKGRAGMKTDKRTEVEAQIKNMPVAPWMPKEWNGAFRGNASGEILYSGKDRGLQTSSGHGSLSIAGARITNAPFLAQAAALTKKEVFKDLRFDDFSMEFEWDYPRIEIRDIHIEMKDVLSIRGSFVINRNALDGKIQLALTPENLDWLPKAEEIFTQARGKYRIATVRFFGTLEEPREDLSPRLLRLFTQSPAIYLGAGFRLLGGWIGNFFESDSR